MISLWQCKKLRVGLIWEKRYSHTYNAQPLRSCKDYWMFNIKTVRMYYEVHKIWNLNIWKQEHEAQEYCYIAILFVYYLKVG